jgi:hypothetical protein
LTQKSELTTYFGDIHNHNVIGYAQGTLRRSFEIARNHLDFYAFTPHAYWPDIEPFVDPQSRGAEDKWINGFAVTKERWPEVIAIAKEFDDPGTFAVLVGYETHSGEVGDHHIIFPDLDGELMLFDDHEEWKKFARKRGCLLFPHHPANRKGVRGANFDVRDPDISPVLEMYSEWGCAEHDRAAYPYKRHSEGGRWTGGTAQALLAQGHRFGFIASTDQHLGYPGAYREGLAAIKAPDLTREAIFDSIRKRQTYAVTGDRIDVDFFVNGEMMGRELPYSQKREIEVSVEGWDQIDCVEVIKNNRVIHRDFPMDREPSESSWNEPVLIRFEYGWGVWPALGWNRTADWTINLKLQDAELEAVHPCFIGGPLDEDRRDRIEEWDAAGARVISYTSLKHMVDDFSQKGIVLKTRGNPQSTLAIDLEAPTTASISLPFGDLVDSNEAFYTRKFPWESGMIQRVVFKEQYSTSFKITDDDPGDSDSWYYIRVTQANRQMAWSSPIWVNRK